MTDQVVALGNAGGVGLADVNSVLTSASSMLQAVNELKPPVNAVRQFLALLESYRGGIAKMQALVAAATSTRTLLQSIGNEFALARGAAQESVTTSVGAASSLRGALYDFKVRGSRMP